MSVLTPIVATWDGANRRAYLAEGTADYYPIEDLYHEYRHARRTDLELRKYAPLLRAEGNIKKGGGAFTPRYVVLLDGFKIIPFNETLQLNQLGDMITDDPDTDATLYDISGLTVPKPIFIKPSNAETVQLNSESIVFSSFQGAVWYNADSPYSEKGSATEPNGNTERPVNSIPLAVQIATERGFRTIQVIGDLTLGLGDDVAGFELIGVSHVNSVLTVETGAYCFKTRFTSFDMNGTLDGDSEINNCVVNDLAYFNGHIHDSLLNGTVTLQGNANAVIDDCAMLNILNPPTIDCNYSDQNLVMTNWSGQLNVINSGVNNNIGIGCDAADLVIDASCTDGIIAISGTGSVLDNSGPIYYVINKIIDGSEIQNLKVLIEQLRPHHTGGGKVIFWDPTNGSDVHHGDAPDRGFKTFSMAHSVAEDAGHDTIVIVPSGGAVTMITEEMNVTKDYLFIRGPGRDVITTAAVTTNARGTEFSGFRINNTGIGAVAVESTGPFTLLDNIWAEDCDHGFHMTASHPLIHSCKIHGSVGYAIHMEGEIDHGEIYDCTMGDSSATAVIIDTHTGWGGIKMRDTVIVGAAEYGVALSTTTRKFISQSGNVIINNTLGDFNDLGIGNILNVEGASTLTVAQDTALMLTKYQNKAVYVDTELVTNGDGTATNPFNNVEDAKDFAEANGILTVYVYSDVVIPSNVKNFTVIGIGSPVVNCNGQDLKNTEFVGVKLQGTYTDRIKANKCSLDDGFHLNGGFKDCSIFNSVTCIDNGFVTMTNCFSNVGTDGLATISLNGIGSSKLSVINFGGDLTLTDVNSIDDFVKVTMPNGTLSIASSCTNGSIAVAGHPIVTDASGIGCTVNLDALIDPATTTDTIVASQL